MATVLPREYLSKADPDVEPLSLQRDYPLVTERRLADILQNLRSSLREDYKIITEPPKTSMGSEQEQKP
ncbi:Hypothetical predicted protein [Pelobates cultripes]|uniref:Uncharacterized protein n=1 Tax=Pelobates cultripes TaxID=61616 RepID=A0AAD1SW54_PELCU|nr:Hypothetical predicted protein [Pelobates cultripes]